jgi:hypothetical protein
MWPVASMKQRMEFTGLMGEVKRESKSYFLLNPFCKLYFGLDMMNVLYYSCKNQ